MATEWIAWLVLKPATVAMVTNTEAYIVHSWKIYYELWERHLLTQTLNIYGVGGGGHPPRWMTEHQKSNFICHVS